MTNDIKVTSKKVVNSVLVIGVNDSEVELFIQQKGDTLDLFRTKIRVNVPNKYTTSDLHTIQETVFSELFVSTTVKEIEKKLQ